jgi:hypothetical protein
VPLLTRNRPDKPGAEKTSCGAQLHDVEKSPTQALPPGVGGGAGIAG